MKRCGCGFGYTGVACDKKVASPVGMGKPSDFDDIAKEQTKKYGYATTGVDIIKANFDCCRNSGTESCCSVLRYHGINDKTGKPFVGR